MDLAEGHLAALQYVDRAAPGASTYSVFNLGSGHGYSVLEMLHAMNKACGEYFLNALFAFLLSIWNKIPNDEISRVLRKNFSGFGLYLLSLFMFSSKQAKSCRTSLPRAVRGTSPCATRIRRKPPRCWAGLRAAR